MKSSTRPVRLAVAAGLILAAALAAIVGGRSYSLREQPAEPETLERIARKNDAAAMRSAAEMKAKSDASAAATSRPPIASAPSEGKADTSGN